MSKWVAKSLADAAAAQLQLQIGQAYETAVIFPMLNRVYEEVWNYADWPPLTVADTLTVAANSDRVVLPKEYEKLIDNFTTPADLNNPSDTASLQQQLVSILRMGRTRWLQEFAPQYNSTFLGEQSVKAQPASADAPKAVSSSASDTAIKVHIEGWLNGDVVMQTVTLTGATPVAFSTSFDKIDSVSKSGKSVGVVSVTSNSGATTYSTLAPWELVPCYSAYQLDAKPTTATTVNIIARKRFVPFLHYMSAPFMDAIAGPLIDGTIDLCMAEQRQQDYAGYYRQRMMRRLSALRSEQNEPMEGPIGRA